MFRKEADHEQTSEEKVLCKSPRSLLDHTPKKHICVEEEETSHQKLVDNHHSWVKLQQAREFQTNIWG